MIGSGAWSGEDEKPPAGVDPAEGADQEEALPVVHGSLEVTASLPELAAVTVVGTETVRSTRPLGDGSEVLRSVPGVDLSRMGGHGLEPFVRGLSQGGLTVLIDGATINGGCPNRMDPATSYAAGETTDRVVVLRGVQTLRHGPGGPGGTVIFERDPPDFGSDEQWRAEATLTGGSWLDGPAASVDAAVGFGNWSVRAMASARDQKSYEDGDGVEVRSAARSAGATIALGWRPDEMTMASFSYERARTEDALFAGAGMDSPESTIDILRFDVSRSSEDGGAGWRAEAFWNAVDHLMDNYSLRPLTAPMAMRAPTETTTWGARGHVELGHIWRWIVGAEIESAENVARRYAGPSPEMTPNLQSLLWPDVERREIGLFAEGAVEFGGSLRFVYGLRGDRFTAEARAADTPTMSGNGPTPRQLWKRYGSSGSDDWSATGVGGLLRVEHRYGRSLLSAGLSRSVRAADASERFIASNSSMAGMRWVGNPDLGLPAHHQLDLGYQISSARSMVGLSVFADDVSRFILRDRAHGQSGVPASDSATIYRNVDVRRYGTEAEALVHLSAGLTAHGTLSWVWAENTTDDRPVAQTPPLAGIVGLAWAPGRWSIAGTVRWADSQNRVDDDPSTGSGLDAGPTPGWAVLDLSAACEIPWRLRLELGVDNVFDRTYAGHLNRASLFDPEPVRVNEPGRSVWVRLGWNGGG